MLNKKILGFSMIETMLAGVLLAGIIVMLLKFVSSTDNDHAKMAATNNFSALTNDITGKFITDIKNCQFGTGGCNFTSGTQSYTAVDYAGISSNLKGIDPSAIIVQTCVTSVDQVSCS